MAYILFAGVLTLGLLSCTGSKKEEVPSLLRAPQSPPDRATLEVVEAVAAIPLFRGDKSAVPTATPTPDPNATPITVNLQDLGESGEYKFDPSALTFKAGESVSFTFAAETEFHTFTVDDLGIDVGVDGGDTVTFSFTFDKAGAYRLFCIPHESEGMVGTITVTE